MILLYDYSEMNRLLAVGIIELSDGAISAMRRNGVNSLQDLMIQRDLGFLTSELFGSEYLQELLSACEKIDGFNEGLKKEIVPAKIQHLDTNKSNDEGERSETLNTNRSTISDGRRRTKEGIMKDLASIANLETPTSLRKAILKLMIDHPGRAYDRKTIKNNLERKYKKTISINTDALRSNLSTLESHWFIERITSKSYYKITQYALNEFSKLSGAKNYYEESKKVELLKKKEIDDFIVSNVGREIEFRYRTERKGSDKWWRRVRVHDQDDTYLYTTDYYPAGGRMRYLKERIVEYREVESAPHDII